MLWAGRKGELLLVVIFSGAVLGGGWWLSGRLVRDLSFPAGTGAPRLRPADLAVGFPAPAPVSAIAP